MGSYINQLSLCNLTCDIGHVQGHNTYVIGLGISLGIFSKQGGGHQGTGHLAICQDTLDQIRGGNAFAELQKRSDKLVEDCQKLN